MKSRGESKRGNMKCCKTEAQVKVKISDVVDNVKISDVVDNVKISDVGIQRIM